MVRHRREQSVVTVIFALLAIGGFVYGLVTSDLSAILVILPIVAIAQMINFVYTSRRLSFFVEKYDRVHDQGANSG